MSTISCWSYAVICLDAAIFAYSSGVKFFTGSLFLFVVSENSIVASTSPSSITKVPFFLFGLTAQQGPIIVAETPLARYTATYEMLVVSYPFSKKSRM